MKVPCCLTISTSGAPSAASTSMPSSEILATVGRIQLGLLGAGLRRDLGVRAGRRRRLFAAHLGVDEVDYGAWRLHAVGVGEVVVGQVLVGQPGELVLVVVH